METLVEMKERHRLEYEELRARCQHADVDVMDRVLAFRHREIFIVCRVCGKPIVGWLGDGVKGCVQYAEGFREETE